LNGWFGEDMRGTPASRYLPEIQAPADEPCAYCGVPIMPGDSGDMLVGQRGNGNIVHLFRHQDCAIYAVLGSRWCRAEGVQLISPQHKRYHQLRDSSFGHMTALAIERRVLLEFDEYVDDNEIRSHWKREREISIELSEN